MFCVGKVRLGYVRLGAVRGEGKVRLGALRGEG